MASIITRVLAWLFSGTVIASIIRYIFEVVGVGVVSYVGFSFLIDQLNQYAANAFSQSGNSDALAFIGLFGFDQAVNLILSGCSIRVVAMSLSRFRRR